MAAQGMAAAQAPYRQHAAVHKSMHRNRLARIARAGWFEAAAKSALKAEPRPQRELINSEQRRRHSPGHRLEMKRERVKP